MDLMPSSLNQKHSRLGRCMPKPRGVTSGSQPQNSRLSQCLAMSGMRLAWGAISPTGSQPQTCLAPQYHPSQESMLRICRV